MCPVTALPCRVVRAIRRCIVLLGSYHEMKSHCWASQSRVGGAPKSQSVITFENAYNSAPQTDRLSHANKREIV